MTAGEHEMPPHLARYVASLSDPGKTADASPRPLIDAGYDPGRYPAPASPETAAATPALEAGQEAGHVDPAAAARWHRAQTELAGLIRAESRTVDRDTEAGRVLPASLADWMEKRVAELEQAETGEPELG